MLEASQRVGGRCRTEKLADVGVVELGAQWFHGMDGNPDKLGTDDKWETYKDKRGDFRWRRIARNGRITGTSSEGYASKARCECNAKHNGKP